MVNQVGAPDYCRGNPPWGGLEWWRGNGSKKTAQELPSTWDLRGHLSLWVEGHHKKIRYRCHPSYRGGRWYDWANIDWTVKTGGEVHNYVVPARVLLWMKPVLEDSSSTAVSSTDVYALVHSLERYETPTYSFMPMFSADVLNDKPCCMQYQHFDSPALVLPGVQIRGDQHSDVTANCRKHKYWVVIPRHCQWPDLCLYPDNEIDTTDAALIWCTTFYGKTNIEYHQLCCEQR